MRDLPVIDPNVIPAAPSETPSGGTAGDACCAACAAAPPTGAAKRTPAPPVVLAHRPPSIRRETDRRITAAGMAVAACLLAAAATTAILAARGIGTPWAALHLALAGAGGTAVAAVLPFFAAALAQAAPARPGPRGGAIVLVAVGAVAVAVGGLAGIAWLAVAGGSGYILGMLLTAAVVFGPLRQRLASQRNWIALAYGAAIGEVVVGVSLGTALFGGLAPVVADWAVLKPAHAWLNAFGFLSVVVAVTLVHLAPTVAGSRIRPHRTIRFAIPALLVAPVLIAAGYVTSSDVVARLGAALEIVGAMALVGHALAVQRGRGRWTTDPGWHRLTIGSLLAAPAWFAVAVGIAAGRILAIGASPAAWDITVVTAPLVAGWIAQVLVGAWSHLLPAVGPGDQHAHADQRGRLGRWAGRRLLTWNAGVAILSFGLLTRSTPVTAVGGALVLAALGVALLLFAGSLALAAPQRRTAPAA